MRMEDQTDEEVKAEMMSNLKLMFPSIPEPDRVVITRWGKEPNVLGGYSHPTIGRDFASDSSTLGLPVGRIIFAGEATAGSWYATTVGAWSTGQRAANEMKQYLTSWSTIPTWSPTRSLEDSNVVPHRPTRFSLYVELSVSAELFKSHHVDNRCVDTIFLAALILAPDRLPPPAPAKGLILRVSRLEHENRVVL